MAATAPPSSLTSQLSQQTFLFGLRLWVVVGIGAGAFFAFLLFCASLCLFSRRKWRRRGSSEGGGSPFLLACETGKQQPLPLPLTHPHTVPRVSKVITEVLPANIRESPEEMTNGKNKKKKKKTKTVILADYLHLHPDHPAKPQSGHSRTEPDAENPAPHRRTLPDEGSHSGGSSGVEELGMVSNVPEVSHLGWGRWYTLRDLELATCGFSDSAILGEGGYGMVYQGQLPDGTPIAVKNLLNNRGQAEKEFKVEVEAIGRVRHKNLVRLLGYCAEGSHRMLVYEYLNNGTLEQWLHGRLGEGSPIPWNVRMKIILGTSKGLAYLHEGLEPKVVHRDVKSSNILLDLNWNAKVSDFGLAKLLGSGKTHVTTRVMGTFGYVAPEYANTGLLNERSDVYSFGILFMELITGRDPVDYGRPAGEVNLVDWLKMMVGNRRSDEVADPRLEVKPSPRALKRALLVALRCVDPDPLKRPRMGQIVHMLESDDYPFQKDRKSLRHASGSKEASASLPEQIPVSQSSTSPKDSTTGKGGSPPQQIAASTSENEEEYSGFSYKPRSKRYQV